MRKIDTNSYNTTLSNKLEDLDRLLEQITPEFVNRFPLDLLKRLSDVDAIKYRYAAESSINGVTGDKLNGMVSYLKTSKQEYQVVTTVVDAVVVPPDTDDDETAARLDREVYVKAPAGYDGRNSISYVYLPDGEFGRINRGFDGDVVSKKFWPISSADQVVIQLAIYYVSIPHYISTLFWRTV
jgi:hypothetical protein